MGSMGVNRLKRLLPVIQAQIQAERAQLPLWLPVFLAIGIGIYFGMPEEPSWSVFVFPGLLLGLFLFLIWSTRLLKAGLIIALPGFAILVGFAAIMLRAELVAGPVLQKKQTVTFYAVIDQIEPDARGYGRVLFRDVEFEGQQPAKTPRKIRLTVNFPVSGYIPGDRVRGRAVLLPIPGPVEPGGFDVARQLWFDGIGAVGFALAPPEVIGSAARFTDQINRARADLTDWYMARFEQPYGAFAAALTTGLRRALPDKDVEAMRMAGLAHMLAISGLHMGLVMGGVFFAFRLVIAGIPTIALNFRSDRIAAVAALLVGAGYLALAGGSVPTVRAFIMACVAFGALFLDRRPISLRTVALAALIVLLIMPESLIEAGFQMSFAAVVALVAGYEALMRWKPDLLTGRGRGIASNIRIYLVGLIVTSLIAGLATGAFAAFHFGRVSHYGLLANALAVPVLGLVILPGLMLDGVLSLLGLQVLSGWFVELGLKVMLWVAHWVAGLPGATGGIKTGPIASLILLAFAGLWLCLWKGWLRSAAILPAALAFALWVAEERPLILADREGGLVGVLNGGDVRLISGNPNSYAAERWGQADGLGDHKDPLKVRSCDRQGCVMEDGDMLIAHPQTMAAAMEDCRRADIVITELALSKRSCPGPAVLIDKWDFWRAGAHMVIRDEGDGTWIIRRSNDLRGARSWVPRHQWPEDKKENKRFSNAGPARRAVPVP